MLPRGISDQDLYDAIRATAGEDGFAASTAIAAHLGESAPRATGYLTMLRNSLHIVSRRREEVTEWRVRTAQELQAELEHRRESDRIQRKVRARRDELAAKERALVERPLDGIQRALAAVRLGDLAATEQILGEAVLDAQDIVSWYEAVTKLGFPVPMASAADLAGHRLDARPPF